MRILRKIIIYIIILMVLPVFAQEDQPEEYKNDEITAAYDGKNYDEVIKISSDILVKYYEENVENKRLPSEFTTVGSVEEAIDLNKMYRERKNKLYFIREDSKMYFLYYYLALSYREKGDHDRATSHFYQALRYAKVENNKTDKLFYEISQNFKKANYEKAYYDTLETAYTFSADDVNYNYELGKELYRTKQVKKSIFHLKKYLDLVSGDTDDLSVYLMLASQSEQVGKYLDTLKYYNVYLNKKQDDADIWFAYGYIAYHHTGNYKIALQSFQKSLVLLPDTEIYKKSKSYEYTGDMLYKNLKFTQAIDAYANTKKYQDEVKKQIDSKNMEIKEIDKELNDLKAQLLKKRDFIKYNEYSFQQAEKDRLVEELYELEYQYKKLNRGKIVWNSAKCFEKLEQYTKAIENYRQCITLNYKANKSRSNIIKLQLKIRRGY